MTTTKNKTKGAHPLAQFIPDSYFYDEYIGREINGVEDLVMLASAHRLKHNVLLAGPTGAAKTSFVYAYAAKHEIPVVNVACNGGADIRQLIGGWSPKPDGGYHYVPGDLVLGVMHGAIILLNEVNFMPPKIAAVLYGLLDRRRTIYLPDAAGSDFPTVVKAHDNTLVVADYNPGYEGTRPLNKAFKNRFAFKNNWGYDTDVEGQLLNSATLLEVGEKLRLRVDAGDLVTPVPTNALMEFEDFAWDDDLGYDFAVNNFVAMFEEDEQQVVFEVFEVHKTAIMEELDLSYTDSEGGE
jgi:MoxR-like ATPase